MSRKQFSWTSRSPAQTRRLAARLGERLAPGDVIALKGELGSGKTEFVHGLAQGLAVPAQTPVASPSFTLAHHYPGRLPLVHLDLYRLEHPSPEMPPHLEEYLDGPGAAVVEWADRAGTLLPADHLEILLAITGSRTRQLTFLRHGPRSRELLDYLKDTLSRKPKTVVRRN